MARALIAAVVVVLALTGGCGEAPHPYADRPLKNLQVAAVSNSGGSVALEVHSCKGAYEGFVLLDRQAVELGLPLDRPSILVFDFRSLGVSNKKEVLVAPRSGYRYQARVSLKEGIYDIELREINVLTGADREIDAHRSC